MRPPESWQRARVTLAIAAVTAFVSVLVEMLGQREWATMWAGFIPARFSMETDFPAAPALLTPLTATLVHAGLVHLAFNLLIHLFCGRSVEGVIGPLGLGILYVAGAFVAAGAQYLVGPTEVTPMIGASGGISAILGAYAMLFGRNKVKVANSTLALWLNALWLMAGWVGLQLIMGYGIAPSGINVAIAAHIGGFLAGIALARPLLLLRYRNA